MSADFSLDTFASACVAAYGPRAKRMVLDERTAPESEMYKLVVYKYEHSCLIFVSPETFRFTVAEMLTGNFDVRPDDDQDTPNDPGAIFYFTFAERKEFAALDFLEGPVALALDSALVRLHERATREYTALADAAEVSNEPGSALFRVPYVLMKGLADRAHEHMAECAVEADLAHEHMAECAAEERRANAERDDFASVWFLSTNDDD
jgi:hypothetical protein